MSLDLTAIEQRANAATPGPWGWFGNTDNHNVYLSSISYGRQFVMGFRRWGLNGAQPTFCDGRTWTGKPDSDADFTGGRMAKGSALITKASDLAVYEVAPDATDRDDPRVYRGDIRGFRNPDAEFIAHARQDVDDLLAEVKRLRAGIKDLVDWADGLQEPAVMVMADDLSKLLAKGGPR